MGIFKDYRTLSKQTREMSARHDVAGSLSTMQAKMEALNNSMSNAATGRAMLQGIGCRASAIELLVLVAGRPPMSVSTTEIVPQMYLARTVPGSTIQVRIMLDDPSDVFIDWTAA
jgi:hypothetical protein